MPFYEYQCKSCGHTLEAMQKINDSPLKKCPHCGKSQLTRLMSAPVFRLKGGGWYETDFKGDQDHKKNLADRPESDGAKDDKKTTDSKVEAPAATADKPADKPAEKAVEKSSSPEPKKASPAPSKRGTSAPAKAKAKKAPVKAAKGKKRR